MRAVRSLDSAGDWTFGNGRSNYLVGKDAVSQRLTTRIRLVTNDWFLNLDIGIDYFSAQPFTIIQQIRETILTTDGVVELVSLDSSYDGEERKLVVSAIVRDEQNNLIEVTT